MQTEIESADLALANAVSLELRDADKRGLSGAEVASLRIMRNALMLRLYTRGQTLQQVGDRFGLTRERVRQIITRQVGRDGVKQLPTRFKWSDGAREAARQRGRKLRAAGSWQRYPGRNAEIERLVGTGLSYSQVARELGISRNVVCTVMYRIHHQQDA